MKIGAQKIQKVLQGRKTNNNMKKLPFFIGLTIMTIQTVIGVVMLIASANIPVETFTKWMWIIMLIPLNIVSIFTMVYGLVAEE